MGLRVCIVDDDQGIRESLRTLFEDDEAIVEEASSGEAALALLHASAVPRVLLLDRVMPSMNGIQVLHALEQEPELQKRTAIIFMTARPDPSDHALMNLLKTLHAIALPKPYDIDVLLQQVERSWQRLVDLNSDATEMAM